MNNVLLDELPNEWNGYTINTDYRIGLQIALIQDDEELSEAEKITLMVELLFSNDDGSVREYPTADLEKLIQWYMTGWFLDNNVSDDNGDKKLVDYDVDQWRIYADFLQIYRIDLATEKMHWWKFNGLLWNMPHDQSSFLQCIELRLKKPSKHAGAEERRAIQKAHARYDLKKKAVAYTEAEAEAIDEYDRMMNEARKKKEEKERLKALLKG